VRFLASEDKAVGTTGGKAEAVDLEVDSVTYGVTDHECCFQFAADMDS